MTDAPAIQTGENSPEKVAFDLMVIVAQGEGKRLRHALNNGPRADADRKWILDTYAECLCAVRDPFYRHNKSQPQPAERRDPFEGND